MGRAPLKRVRDINQMVGTSLKVVWLTTVRTGENMTCLIVPKDDNRSQQQYFGRQILVSVPNYPYTGQTNRLFCPLKMSYKKGQIVTNGT